ncbi:hypothetical protein [uncultured Bacteroides sp.]|uniref:hypothetical protein n=1 Tax=uncultured Bacteroides sp. TaxID=162156 RepID=UPI0025CBB88B|nr:hypothetical protein [uncultured Bacteroides sp.]
MGKKWVYTEKKWIYTEKKWIYTGERWIYTGKRWIYDIGEITVIALQSVMNDVVK